ncbi:MAG: carbohydrate kinase [Zetaproteobacteria bacterium]|nr:MAG: carbohydrate kinase [Zetaproteobacteria bacterium]
MEVLCVGHASFDVTMRVTRHPAADEKMQAEALQLAGGGPAANAAVQVARLGGSAGFAGRLGRDVFGELHLRELMAEGVDVRGVVRRGGTPLSEILAKPDGTRSVINYHDGCVLASDALDLRGVRPQVLLFDGHEPRLSARLCAWARQEGIPTVLDAGSLREGTRMLAGRVDHLVASERFAREFTARVSRDEMLARLAEVAPHVVITLGADGLLWSFPQGAGRLPAFAVTAVDSTGAGDAFHGAYALALARGMRDLERLRWASAAGALACTRLGARAALPDHEAVARLLAEQDAME